MKRTLAVLAALVAAVGLVAAPAAAQSKVTIGGFIDYAFNVTQNLSSGSVTDDKDRATHHSQRGVVNIAGQVGKSTAVFAFEFDVCSGATPSGKAVYANSGCAGLNTDIRADAAKAGGILEIKHMYLDTPFTGAGAILSTVGQASTIRAGLMPMRVHGPKAGFLWTGDFAGVEFQTALTPTAALTVTYGQVDESIDSETAAGANETYALLASIDVQLDKTTSLKPTLSILQRSGPSGQDFSQWTVGADAVAMVGGLKVEPTFIYQGGTEEYAAGKDRDIAAWIGDLIVTSANGPLTLAGRVTYTTGNSAGDGSSVDRNYYRAISTDSGFYAGWIGVLGAGGVDFRTWFNTGGKNFATNPSYDKYGRMILAGKADYKLTPKTTLTGILNWSWTAEDADTNGNNKGDDNYLGLDTALILAYAPAPGVSFSLGGAYMFMGDAMGVGGKDAEDAWRVTAKIRVTF